MTTTPHGATELVGGQAVPETTVNQQVRHTEAGACHFVVADNDLTGPPGSCADGANYIIAATATGLWAGKETQIAVALGTNAAGGWTYHVPKEGYTAYIQDENARHIFDGAAWAVDTTGGSYTDELAQDAVGAMIDDTLTYNDATPLLRVTQESKAADIASAATVNIGAAVGGVIHITGSVTITAFDSATAGLERTLIFDAALTLTHNATSLILPTGANIVTAAGDVAVFRSEGVGNWRCVSYTRASGLPVKRTRVLSLAITGTALTASEVLAAFTPPSGEIWTFPANFSNASGLKTSGGTNPAASYAIDVSKNGVSVGTITISTSGVVSFATSGGAAFSLTGGSDEVRVVGPAGTDTAVGYAIAIPFTVS